MSDQNTATTATAAAPESRRPLQRDPAGLPARARRAPEKTDDAPLAGVRKLADHRLQAAK